MTTVFANVPGMPEDAPFSGDQKQWIGGFLAGLHTRIAADGASRAPAGADADVKPVDILYGTQTGNAETVAADAAEKVRARGLVPRLAEMDDVEMATLAGMRNLIVIVSTYGEGEMPDNARRFWEALSADTAPRLEGLTYAVLGLGDTGYDDFCEAGKLVDMRLEQLGAKRLTGRVDCDVDFEDAAAAWLEEAIPDPADVAAGPAVNEAGKGRKPSWSRKNPYMSVLRENRTLSGVKSAKEIRHFIFDLGTGGLSYEAGDALGVMPVNAPGLVDAWIDRLGATFDTDINGSPLGALLSTGLEIVTPSRDLIRAIAAVSGDEELKHVHGSGDKEALENYLRDRDALDLLNLNPGLRLDPAEVTGWLKPLQHRAYSISSSPLAHPGEVHLTVAAVRWLHADRPHGGVCSTFLADRVPEGEPAGIFVSPNKNFRVPEDDSAPMIMVGPGTGVAPFRAFLQERRERGAGGPNWLFFGDQHRDSDFIYADEIDAFSKSGLLTRLDLAFSRDQSEKVYVQHLMAENGKDLYAYLEEGGYFFVCGDATRMAKDVDAVLHRIIATEGGMTTEEAADYVRRLRQEKRYVRDVY